MNRLLILLFSIFLIGCCNEPKLLHNGLTQKAIQITEYTIKVENDSLNNVIQDTLVITEKKYNENDQIISQRSKDGENITRRVKYILIDKSNHNVLFLKKIKPYSKW